jgi:beta-galactosidase/beta-glucuronidase
LAHRLLPLLARAAFLAAAAIVPAGSAAAAPPAPPPAPKLVVDTPTKRVLIREGQAGRRLVGGRWYFRQDDALQGESARFFAQRSLAGWIPIKVPNDWNAADTTLNRQGVGWYRKEFKLPRMPRGTRWKVRFESVGNRATVWLNGRNIGGGGPGYLPFELDLKRLRKGRNRLVVRVSSRRNHLDLTHWRPFGSGGWWNFGGISREVYMRPIDTVDIEDLAVLPRLRCVRCNARVEVRVRLRNLSRRTRRLSVVLRLRREARGSGSTDIALPSLRLAANSGREIVKRFTLRHPHLWQPGRPNLYALTSIAAVQGRSGGSFRRVARFRRWFGVRRIERRRDGSVLLNGHRLRLRGASIHEDDPVTGAALTPRQRSRIVSRVRQLGATVVRSHYPLHPAFLEAFDRRGVLVWSGAPVYQLPNSFLNVRSVRSAAIAVNQRMVLRDRSHPSVLAWSIANELAEQVGEGGVVGPGYARYVVDAARAVRRLDKTRLVALDRHLRIGEPVFAPALTHVDALGINEYFGWYKSSAAGLPPSKTTDLGPVLDQFHAAYPHTAFFITEFGAEATGHGPVGERGTFEFQSRWLLDHLAIHASRSFLNGSMIWILKDFRVTPTWIGGNSSQRSTPPWNNKGLIDQSGAPKPAFSEVRRLYRRTRPLR